MKWGREQGRKKKQKNKKKTETNPERSQPEHRRQKGTTTSGESRRERERVAFSEFLGAWGAPKVQRLMLRRRRCRRICSTVIAVAPVSDLFSFLLYFFFVIFFRPISQLLGANRMASCDLLAPRCWAATSSWPAHDQRTHASTLVRSRETWMWMWMLLWV